MDSRIRYIRKTFSDIRHGRHLEAYALFAVGVALVLLGLVGVANTRILLSVILLALSFLVFHTSVSTSTQKPRIDEMLRDRNSFGSFSKILPGVRDLRIYGPTAVNVLVGSGDIKRFVLRTGGTVRVLVQEDEPSALLQSAFQLDDNLDIKDTLRSSVSILEKLAREPGFSYGRLLVNPGFSLVIVNADQPDGYLIFESHGFRDENIADRMHIVITRKDSIHWFGYWVGRFDAMWQASIRCSAEP